ncbi:PH domain-containing protein [Methanoregula sp.]|uniref:PH domain-containing protein n=1 Tax=Methanoregula sp. TaxID=2052170 RepID=UPI003568F6BA
MSWKRGIWFRTTGIVPYNRITNLDIRQGPVMRALGISTLAIQTAGYSGQVASEIKIEGVTSAEELREFIRSMIRQMPQPGDGTGGEKNLPATTDQKILDELTKIRILLEEQKKQGR